MNYETLYEEVIIKLKKFKTYLENYVSDDVKREFEELKKVEEFDSLEQSLDHERYEEMICQNNLMQREFDQNFEKELVYTKKLSRSR